MISKLTEAIVLATDWLGGAIEVQVNKRTAQALEMYSPAVASNANDGDRVAGEADGNANTNNGAHEAEKTRGGCAISTLNTVAALNRSSVALSGTRTSRGWDGGRKRNESEGSESGELELHLE